MPRLDGLFPAVLDGFRSNLAMDRGNNAHSCPILYYSIVNQIDVWNGSMGEDSYGSEHHMASTLLQGWIVDT